MAGSSEACRPRAPNGTARSSFYLSTRLSLVLLFVAYVPLALTFSLLTRAYAGDDEAAHTAYIEYVVRHDSIPRIAGGESQQPPLYYFLAAGWQHLLGI